MVFRPQFPLTSVNGTVFFSADDGVNGKELWKSDGTEAGTVLVMGITAGPGNSFPFHLTDVNGTLFFTATDGTTGYEIWKSDGTEAGTVLTGEVVPGPGDGYAQELTAVGSLLFFSAEDEAHGRELWALDTTANHAPVLDTAPVPMLPAIPVSVHPLPAGGLVSDLTENVTDSRRGP